MGPLNGLRVIELKGIGPGPYAGMLLAGSEPRRIRSTAFEMEIPEVPEGASFFEQQAAS